MRWQVVAKFAAARAVAPRYKVQGVAVGRVGGCGQSCFAGHGDGRGWQACAGVGVVGGVALQVGTGDVAVVTLAHAVDDGGVGLQAHIDFQAIDHGCGYQWAVGAVACFFFYDAGEFEQVVGGLQGQVTGAALPCGFEFALHGLAGEPQDVQVGRVAGVFVGIGEEHAFKRVFMQVKLLQQLGFAHACAVVF